jgi:hypothetical protein
MAAQAEAKLDALVLHHTRSIIAHAKEVDALKAELASKTPKTMNTPETDSPPQLVRPYFLLSGVSEVPLSHYQGMKVGLPPICICCRRATDGPASGCAEALCLECYELVRTRGSSLRTHNETTKP